MASRIAGRGALEILSSRSCYLGSTLQVPNLGSERPCCDHDFQSAPLSQKAVRLVAAEVWTAPASLASPLSESLVLLASERPSSVIYGMPQNSPHSL